MTGIWEYPQLEELEQFIIDGVSEARSNVIERLEEPRKTIARRLSLERLLVIDSWGRGNAEKGDDILSIVLFFDMEGEPAPHNHPEFDPGTRTIVIEFLDMIDSGEITPPESAFEWFANIDPTPVAITRYEDQVSRSLGSGEGNTVFDLTTKQAISFSEGVPNISNLPRIPLERLRGEEEEIVEEPEVEEVVEDEIDIGPKYPDINENLREFAISEDKLNIPAGKGKKTVEPREPYKFELMMALTLDEIRERGLEGGEEPTRQITNGIGFEVQIGRLGNGAPPSTYPRTSSYIKNRLMYEGPAYILELHNDLVFYSGFISGFYGMNLRAGHYSSFRQFIYRLKEIGERGGPKLIEPLSQQQAAARGFDVIANHPTIEGEKAPWLENRQYYQIVEDNYDHEAWKNPVEYLQQTLASE